MDKADIAQDYIDWRMEQALAARQRAADINTQSVGECQECVDCGGEIPAARRERLPGVRTCVPCQTAREARR
ncbi:phage/conjugal plasmid C-4 type zinc finger protein, TraR family [Onishia taeanensis]|uniref:Phage/conjugal plasmid C-4 type zinc finger protein, TraR family n=1 Tax=Onishia taeanensis TaxID=284577 RepID=A0A1G7N5R9_9GAMM|nr:TraR/DksA C4-type zinc finger protein [Halomonas taeanensis]SDF69237.1 phage/conjugal plasmid C-4 type zinc finger protein, TraR family [Halomonas taeanensis]